MAATPEQVRAWGLLARWDYTLTGQEREACRALTRATIAARGDTGKREKGMTRQERNLGGYMAEVAVARMFGDAGWMPQLVGTSQWREVGDGPHHHGVRWTDKWRNRLIVYQSDPRDKAAISVVGETDRGPMTARGWCHVLDALRPDWEAPDFGRDVKRDGRVVQVRAFLVPNDQLHPMDELVA